MKLNMEYADRAEVIILSDNHCEQVILGGDMVKRPGALTAKPGETEVELKAEHGFSCAVRLFKGNERHSIMLDVGRSGSVAVENASWVGFDLKEIETLVLSHGHWDHVGGISKLAKEFNKPVKVVVHPDAFLTRYVTQADGGKLRFPDFRPDLFSEKEVIFETHKNPVLLANNLIATTGEIPRVTEYEKGFPPQLAVRHNKLVPDIQVWDDQSIVFILKDKGPVIISGCGHSGIVNTVRYCLELTGFTKPLAVIGGFHLCWPTPETVVRATLDDLKEYSPNYIVPCHCTGWETTCKIAREMPESFILSTVGCTISL